MLSREYLTIAQEHMAPIATRDRQCSLCLITRRGEAMPRLQTKNHQQSPPAARRNFQVVRDARLRM